MPQVLAKALSGPGLQVVQGGPFNVNGRGALVITPLLLLDLAAGVVEALLAFLGAVTATGVLMIGSNSSRSRKASRGRRASFSSLIRPPGDVRSLSSVTASRRINI